MMKKLTQALKEKPMQRSNFSLVLTVWKNDGRTA